MLSKPHAPRFVRLLPEQVEALFGASLSPRIEISGGRFVARERVSVVGRSGRLDGVAVVGPVVDPTEGAAGTGPQSGMLVRLGPGDVERLGLDGGGLLLVGPAGEVRVTDGIESAT